MRSRKYCVWHSVFRVGWLKSQYILHSLRHPFFIIRQFNSSISYAFNLALCLRHNIQFFSNLKLLGLLISSSGPYPIQSYVILGRWLLNAIRCRWTLIEVCALQFSWEVTSCGVSEHLKQFGRWRPLRVALLGQYWAEQLDPWRCDPQLECNESRFPCFAAATTISQIDRRWSRVHCLCAWKRLNLLKQWRLWV